MSRPGAGAGEAGQASIELLGAVPLCLAVVLGVAQLLAGGAAQVAAGSAAQAGAMAVLQGGDPARAARAAAPGWSRAHLSVHVDGRRVGVRVTPVALLPGGGRLLAAHVDADAGPAS